MRYEEALSNCIFQFVSGSHAYGTERPDSDRDLRGVFIAPLSKAFELFQTSFVGGGTLEGHLKGAIAKIDEGNSTGAIDLLQKALETDQGDLNFSVGTVHNPGTDEEMQELRKFLKLATDSNPNIVEFLYVDRLVTRTTPIWEKIRASRHMFLSKKARWTFSGYAIAQLKRIKVHRGYLLNPPAKKPDRRDYGLPLDSKVPKESQNAVLAINSEWLSDGVRDMVCREKAYQNAMNEWNAYKKWERERNPSRRETEKKYGYDCKHATHLVRLVRMAKEILSEGVVNVYRPDREELREILNGEWPYEKLLVVTENMDQELDALYRTSTLRDKPDHKGISRLYQEICQEHYGIRLA